MNFHLIYLLGHVVTIFSILIGVGCRGFGSLFNTLPSTNTSRQCCVLTLSWRHVLHIGNSSLFLLRVWSICIWRKSICRCSTLNGQISQSSRGPGCISPPNRHCLRGEISVRYINSPLNFGSILTTYNLLINKFSLGLYYYLVLKRIHLLLVLHLLKLIIRLPIHRVYYLIVRALFLT